MAPPEGQERIQIRVVSLYARGQLFYIHNIRPHRLDGQDAALSRRWRGFESRWGYFAYVAFGLHVYLVTFLVAVCTAGFWV